MEVRRTVPVKLDVADRDAALLHETISEFLWAANYVVDHAWQGDYKTTSKAQLQEETYEDVREQTRLHANLVQNARNTAADAVQSVVARWKQGEYAGKPHFSTPTVVYDKRCATFHVDYASLSTVDGRIEHVRSDRSGLSETTSAAASRIRGKDRTWPHTVRNRPGARASAHACRIGSPKPSYEQPTYSG